MGQKMSTRSERAVSAWTILHPNTFFVMPYYSHDPMLPQMQGARCPAQAGSFFMNNAGKLSASHMISQLQLNGMEIQVIILHLKVWLPIFPNVVVDEGNGHDERNMALAVVVNDLE